MKKFKSIINKFAIVWWAVSIFAFFGTESAFEAGSSALVIGLAINLAASTAVAIGTTQDIKEL